MNFYAAYSKVTGELLFLSEEPPAFNLPDVVGVIHDENGIDLTKVDWDFPSRTFKQKPTPTPSNEP